ncbi:MAG: sodium-dependent transporter, partial [Raoultibacter sp.]
MANNKLETQTELYPEPQREKFGSRMAFVLASMGGAIGLGNVWKFPYMVGKYGGAAFIVVYLLALFFIATPMLMTEFAIGRKTGTSYTTALKKLCPGKKWYLLGIIGVIALTLTLSFYTGIAGWTVAYIFKSISGSYAGANPEAIGNMFGAFISNPASVIFWLAVMLVITTFVVIRGVKGGIEKVCNVLLPVLFVMIIVLAIRSVMMPGAGEGLKFYLVPDFSSLSGEAIIGAIGQSFFTLGVGCGNLVIYGSYLDKKKTIGSSTWMVGIGDTCAAILFGFIIFPAAASFGIEAGMGPPLVFITLPTIFAQMKFGMVFATIFFVLLFFACLTSTICIMEAIVGYLVDELKVQRKKATIIVAVVIFVIGTVMMLSFGPLADVLIFGRTIFDFTNDILVSAVLLPLGGLIMLILIGWVLKPKGLL